AGGSRSLKRALHGVPEGTEFRQDLLAIQRRTAKFPFIDQLVQFTRREIADVLLLVKVRDRGSNDVLRGTIATRPDSFFDQLLDLGRQGELHGFPLRTFYAYD